jgi:hypothetical protein
MAINKFSGALVGVSVVGAKQVYAPRNVAFRPDDIGAVLLQFRRTEILSGSLSVVELRQRGPAV